MTKISLEFKAEITVCADNDNTMDLLRTIIFDKVKSVIEEIDEIKSDSNIKGITYNFNLNHIK